MAMNDRGALPILMLPALLVWAGPAPGAPSAQDLSRMRAFAHELVDSQRYEDAMATYITIAEHAPANARAHYDVAGIMAFLRMFAEAIPHLEKAIALEPDNTLYLEMAALSYLQLKRYEAAFDATARGAKLGDVNAMYTLAGMYEHGRGTMTSDSDALMWLGNAARAGHMGAMDAMARVYRDGLYGQLPDPQQVQRWRELLEREMAR